MRVRPRPISKVPTQISGLDEVLEGGLPRDRTTLASGDTGPYCKARERVPEAVVADPVPSNENPNLRPS